MRVWGPSFRVQRLTSKRMNGSNLPWILELMVTGLGLGVHGLVWWSMVFGFWFAIYLFDVGSRVWIQGLRVQDFRV